MTSVLTAPTDAGESTQVKRTSSRGPHSRERIAQCHWAHTLSPWGDDGRASPPHLQRKVGPALPTCATRRRSAPERASFLSLPRSWIPSSPRNGGFTPSTTCLGTTP